LKTIPVTHHDDAAEISNMTNTIVARWQDWSGSGLEHLCLTETADQIVADAAVVGTVDAEGFAARYRIRCDKSWRVKELEIERIGSGRAIKLASDGAGNWVDGTATALPHLRGAIDVDISATPFTNTLPIRRLSLQRGQSAEILAVYVQVPSLDVSGDKQRYTCLEAGKRYRYESVDSDFTRDIEVDEHGLVVTYPGLFRRVI
jgi:hypothetical protein